VKEDPEVACLGPFLAEGTLVDAQFGLVTYAQPETCDLLVTWTLVICGYLDQETWSEQATCVAPVRLGSCSLSWG